MREALFYLLIHLLLFRENPVFYTAVVLTTFGSIIGINRQALSKAVPGEAAAVNPMCHQIVGHSFGSGFGEDAVAFGSALVVGMPTQLDVHGGVFVQKCDKGKQVVVRLRQDVTLVGI